MANQPTGIFSPDIGRITKALDLIQKNLFSKKLSTEIGMFAMFRIKKRTSEGKDVDSQDFEPYSPAYAKFRRAEGHPADKVNLFFSGSMLSSMSQREREKETTIFFLPTKDQNDVSNPEKAFWLNQKREFFALSEEDIRLINRIAEDYYQRIVNRFTSEGFI
jgi:hypothetical protein